MEETSTKNENSSMSNQREFLEKELEKVRKAEEESMALYKKPLKKELIEMLDEMNASIEKMPVYALSSPVSNLDLSALLILLAAIFKSDLDCK
jgi:hypothetical protein